MCNCNEQKEIFFEEVDIVFRKNKDVTIQKPKRATSGSAGYDFFSPVTIKIKPKTTEIIWTDIKAKMPEGIFLSLVVRSSFGIKRSLRLKNTLGVIDKDYYNNPENDGLIGVFLYNEGDEEISIKKGEAFCQGIFMPYYKIKDDIPIKNTREGGFGSTDKENKNDELINLDI